jgi:hypothetical protein
LTLRAAPAQKVLKRGALTLTLACDEACSARVAATLTVTSARAFRLRGVLAHGAAGRRVTVLIKLSARSIKALRKALAANGRARLGITVRAKDAAGNASLARLSVRLLR